MQVSISKICTFRALGIVLASVIYLPFNVELAISGGTDTLGTTSISNSGTAPANQSATSLSVTPTTLLQTGTNNYASVNSSAGALGYPNCSGTCAFAIGRVSPSQNTYGSNSNTSQFEAVFGIVHSFNSPDQTNAETNRLLVEIQKYRNDQEIITGLSEKLADAIESGKYERANIIAIILAPKLGKDYQTLLREVKAKL